MRYTERQCRGPAIVQQQARKQAKLQDGQGKVSESDGGRRVVCATTCVCGWRRKGTLVPDLVELARKLSDVKRQQRLVLRLETSSSKSQDTTIKSPW